MQERPDQDEEPIKEAPDAEAPEPVKPEEDAPEPAPAPVQQDHA